jgi:hypothetical protein
VPTSLGGGALLCFARVFARWFLLAGGGLWPKPRFSWRIHGPISPSTGWRFGGLSPTRLLATATSGAGLRAGGARHCDRPSLAIKVSHQSVQRVDLCSALLFVLGFAQSAIDCITSLSVHGLGDGNLSVLCQASRLLRALFCERAHRFQIERGVFRLSPIPMNPTAANANKER